jgi:hypothetical protein
MIYLKTNKNIPSCFKSKIRKIGAFFLIFEGNSNRRRRDFIDRGALMLLLEGGPILLLEGGHVRCDLEIDWL